METNGNYSGELIARLLEITERRLQQLAREGVVPKAARGQYPLVQCVQGYIRYLQSSARSKADSRKEAPLNVPQTEDPLEFLIAAMKDESQDSRLRVRAAVAATQYLHAKKEGGKKDERAARSEQASRGKFAASAPPKLSIVN